MSAFVSLKELLKTLRQNEELLSEMFGKRHAMKFKYSYALSLLEGDDQKINLLIDKGVLFENNNILEINDLYLTFFENVLAPNEEINTYYVDSKLNIIKEKMGYYLKEPSQKRKDEYLKEIKNILRRLDSTLLQNIVKLQNNVNFVFENEPTYSIKIDKLERLDENREAIQQLIDETAKLITKGSRR